MDKDGVRDNANLLTQLNAELLVSLSIEADRVSKRNLEIAQMSLGVAAIALLVSVFQSICK
ncbi:MAG: hypothetical protein RLZZ399_2152 [Verrucomicrobiota bacterium]